MLYKDKKQFKSSLTTYLIEHVFYNIDDNTNQLLNDYGSLYIVFFIIYF
jgi:hypothetical protein